MCHDVVEGEVARRGERVELELTLRSPSTPVRAGSAEPSPRKPTKHSQLITLIRYTSRKHCRSRAWETPRAERRAGGELERATDDLAVCGASSVDLSFEGDPCSRQDSRITACAGVPGQLLRRSPAACVCSAGPFFALVRPCLGSSPCERWPSHTPDKPSHDN